VWQIENYGDFSMRRSDSYNRDDVSSSARSKMREECVKIATLFAKDHSDMLVQGEIGELRKEVTRNNEKIAKLTDEMNKLHHANAELQKQIDELS
jgi:predicted  nucleic acid-binding Zn-ribbon protein